MGNDKVYYYFSVDWAATELDGVKRIKAIDRIISKNAARAAARKASLNFGFNVNKDLRLKEDGTLILNLSGKESGYNNCIYGALNLELGSVGPVSKGRCFIENYI